MKEFRDAFFDEVYQAALRDSSIVLLTADQGAMVLDQFKKDMSDRFFNVGIAEQNMINVAVGLALTGKRVFAHAIASFAVYRCYEQIKLGMGDARLPIVLVGAGPGLSYAWDGPSHHCLHDVPLMKELGITILTPQSAEEAAEAGKMACCTGVPLYVRLPTAKLMKKWGDYTDPYADIPFEVSQ